MLDSSHPPVATISTGSATESLVVSSYPVGRKPTPVGISQTVFKWQPLALGEQFQSAPSPQAELAMAELLEVIQRLKSPLGGWPRNLAPTPENLTLYVLDEASAVVDLLVVEAVSEPHPTGDLADSAIAAMLARPYSVLADWTPKLLWVIARSSYLVMQLLGGIRATVQLATGEPESGTLRLRAILTSAASDPVVADLAIPEDGMAWLVDLATHTLPQPGLPDDTQVEWRQSGTTVSCQSGDLLAELRQAIADTTPELALLMRGVGADWLQPGQA